MKCQERTCSVSVNQLVSYSTDDVWIKTMFVLSPFSQKKDCSFSFLNRICGQKECKIIFSFVEIQPRKKQSIDSPSLPVDVWNYLYSFTREWLLALLDFVKFMYIRKFWSWLSKWKIWQVPYFTYSLPRDTV